MFALLTIVILGFVFVVIFVSLIIPSFLKSLSNLSSKSGERKTASACYTSQGSLLSAAEKCFFEALFVAINGQYWIFPKVRLADIVKVGNSQDRSTWQTAFNQISRKHVDFVLCTPGDYKIIALIELDDASHNRSDRRERDERVDDIAKDANLPIIHFRAAASYDTKVIVTQIFGLKPPPLPQSQ